MNDITVRYKLLREDARQPSYGSEYAAGADLYACGEETVIGPGCTAFIHTGIAVEIPEGYGGFVFARSSLGTKRDLAPANKVGVIDSDYRGEIMVALHNHGGVSRTVEAGERIAQIVFLPVGRASFVLSDDLEDTQRGTGGFGSTGK